MKKLLVLISVLCLLFALCACEKKEENTKPEETNIPSYVDDSEGEEVSGGDGRIEEEPDIIDEEADPYYSDGTGTNIDLTGENTDTQFTEEIVEPTTDGESQDITEPVVEQ